jgi:hypothetical protein
VQDLKYFCRIVETFPAQNINAMNMPSCYEKLIFYIKDNIEAQFDFTRRKTNYCRIEIAISAGYVWISCTINSEFENCAESCRGFLSWVSKISGHGSSGSKYKLHQ